jgi:hypothetical protein
MQLLLLVKMECFAARGRYFVSPIRYAITILFFKRETRPLNKLRKVLHHLILHEYVTTFLNVFSAPFINEANAWLQEGATFVLLTRTPDIYRRKVSINKLNLISSTNQCYYNKFIYSVWVFPTTRILMALSRSAPTVG